MAKEHTHAALICVIVTAVAAAGVAAGIFWKVPAAVIFAALPAAAYEAYRTEGIASKAASAGIVAILVFLGAAILGGFSLNIARLAGMTSVTIRTVRVPLGDVKILAPAVIAALSWMLLRRTGGVYTIWLAAVIFICSLGILYTLNADVLARFMRPEMIEQGLKTIRR